MTNRGRDIIKMMGYQDMDAFVEALGHGEVITIKMPTEYHAPVSQWIHAHLEEIEASNAALSSTLHDIADSLEMARELTRYPVSADICDLNLPHGWPSYCERANL